MPDVPATLRHHDDVFCVLWTLTEGRLVSYGATTADGLFVTVAVPFAHTTDDEIAELLHHAATFQRQARKVAACVGPPRS